MSKPEEETRGPGLDPFITGQALLLREDWGSAERKSDEAIRLGLYGTDRAHAFIFRGLALMHLDGTEDALNSFERALRLPPGEREDFDTNEDLRWSVYQKLDIFWPPQAEAVEEQRGEDAALRYLRERVALVDALPGKHLPNAHLALGVYLGKAGDTEMAAECFEHALEAENVFPEQMHDDYLELVEKARANLTVARRRLGSGRTRAAAPDRSGRSEAERSNVQVPTDTKRPTEVATSRRTSRRWWVGGIGLASLALVGALRRRDASSNALRSSGGSSETAAAMWQVSELGVGPLRVGMTSQEAEQVANGALTADRPARSSCHFLHSPSVLPCAGLMVEDGRVVRVDVDSGSMATTEGARIHDTEQRIKEALKKLS